MKNVPDLFTEEDKVSITRKLHGTNARYGIVRKKKLSLWDRVRKFFGNEWVEFDADEYLEENFMADRMDDEEVVVRENTQEELAR